MALTKVHITLKPLVQMHTHRNKNKETYTTGFSFVEYYICYHFVFEKQKFDISDWGGGIHNV